MKESLLVPTSVTVFTVRIRPYLLWLKKFKRNPSGLLWNSDVIVGTLYLSPVLRHSSVEYSKVNKYFSVICVKGQVYNTYSF